MKKVITGWFKKEIYHNLDNDYSVGKVQILNSNIDKKILKANSTDGYVTIVGYMSHLLKDDLYHFYGDFAKNNYGIQFFVESYEIEEKKDENSLIEFLSSDLFIGIGKKTASKIVSILGDNTIDKIIKDKSVLDSVHGLKENTKNNIYEVLLINYESEKIMRFLLKNGFGSKLSKKIFNKYLQNTIPYLEENPYRLIDEIEGIGFKKADSLAESINFDLKSPYRIQAAINYIFEEYCFNEGFTYITIEQILNKANQFLNEFRISLTDNEIKENIQNLVEKNKIILENSKYYLPTLYKAEVIIAQRIKAIIDYEEELEFNDDEINKMISMVENEIKITYTDKQKEAISTALKSKVTVLTGGPGTGKTTVVNGFLKTYLKLFEIKKIQITKQVALVAPTGRAAKRIAETTNFEASTIHRLLGYSKSGTFSYDENNRLGQKLVIIDESSMIDVLLCANLLKALNNETKIVFIGDINQLPSVGPGEVLKDLIASNIVTTVKLDKIHRQSHDSSIIELAHDINGQKISQDLLSKKNDRNFIRCNNDTLLENLKFIITNAVEKQFTYENIQVLAPMYKGIVGIDNINYFLQDCLNPKTFEKKEITFFNKIFRLGDKVIQLVNKPEKNVMNGDIGYIKHVFLDDKSNDDTKLIIDFDGNEVSYSESDLNDISLAYCISIHKSQGSEFDIVILVLSKSYSIMLRKKLLYTAVTRAKKFLIMIGDVESYKIAVNNSRENIRQTSLKQRLITIKPSEKINIDDFEFSYNKLDITPYEFMK